MTEKAVTQSSIDPIAFKLMQVKALQEMVTGLEDVFHRLPRDAEITAYADKVVRVQAKSLSEIRAGELATVEAELRWHQESRDYASGDQALLDADFDRCVRERNLLQAELAFQGKVQAKGLAALDSSTVNLELSRAERLMINQLLSEHQSAAVQQTSHSIATRYDVARSKDAAQQSIDALLNEIEALRSGAPAQEAGPIEVKDPAKVFIAAPSASASSEPSFEDGLEFRSLLDVQSQVEMTSRSR